jgi:uncharacterized membrane protein YfcA
VQIPSMSVPQAVGLLLVGIVAGALNSVAGGGGFLGFPALLFVGVPAIAANATSAAALLMGNLASLGAYHRVIPRQPRATRVLLAVSLVGGTIGGMLLLLTPAVTFVRLVPWLLLFATLLFALSGPISARLRRVRGQDAEMPWRTLIPGAVAMFGSAIYGGYYGGGNGFVVLAILGLMGLGDIHKLNALRTLLVIVLNVTAVITFVIAGALAWPQLLALMTGAIVGGYVGARSAQRVAPARVRLLVIAIGAALTVYFFVRNAL